jgi:hypothetical protein
MKTILAIIIFFAVVTGGITLVVLSRTRQTTDEVAFASGSKSLLLKDLLDSCDVFLEEGCGNSATSETESDRFLQMNTILKEYPQSNLPTYQEAIPLTQEDSQLLPPRDTAAHLLIRASKESGVNFKAMLVLMTAIGSDPLRRADADMQHPFRDLSAVDGFYAQTKDIATLLSSLKQSPEKILHVGNRTYEIAQDASAGSIAIYQLLASSLTNPEQFERIVLPTNNRYPDNLYNIWGAVLGDKLLSQ